MSANRPAQPGWQLILKALGRKGLAKASYAEAAAVHHIHNTLMVAYRAARSFGNGFADWLMDLIDSFSEFVSQIVDPSFRSSGRRQREQDARQRSREDVRQRRQSAAAAKRQRLKRDKPLRLPRRQATDPRNLIDWLFGREMHADRARKHWRKREDQALAALAERGLSPKQCAERLGRSEGAVRKRAAQLGVVFRQRKARQATPTG